MQKFQLEFPCLFFLEAMGLSLWENKTLKHLAGQIMGTKLVIDLDDAQSMVVKV